jgi:hypothetical protein
MKYLLVLFLLFVGVLSYGQKTYTPKLKPLKDLEVGEKRDSLEKTKPELKEYKSSWIPSLRVKHIKGLKSIEAFYTITDHSMGVQVSFSHFIMKNLYLQYGLDYENGTLVFTKFDHYSIHGLGAYTLFDINNFVYLNGLASVHGGFEELIMTENNATKSAFIVEGAVGLELEFFIVPNITFITAFSQKVYTNSPLGSAYFEGQVGFKYIFK